MRRIFPFIIFFSLASGSILQGVLPIPFFSGRDKKEPIDIEVQNAWAKEAMEKGQAAQQTKNYRIALQCYKKVYKKHPNSSYAPEALYQTARIRFKQKNWRKAFKAYDTIIARYSDYKNFNHVISEQFEIALTLMENKGSRYFGIIPYHNYSSAIQYFETIIHHAPYSDYAPMALMNIGDIHKKKGNMQEAIFAYQRLIQAYPRNMLVPNAYLKLADAFSSLVEGPQYDQGTTREAINTYEDFIILHPEDPEVAKGELGLNTMHDIYAKSKLEMGEFYYKHRDNYTAAKVFFNEAITVAPDSPSAQKARKYLAKIEQAPSATIAVDTSPKQKGLERLIFWNKKSVEEKDLLYETVTQERPDSSEPNASLLEKN